MTVLPIKPASFAGFLLLANLFAVAPVLAQDYVDVEAERRANEPDFYEYIRNYMAANTIPGK